MNAIGQVMTTEDKIINTVLTEKGVLKIPSHQVRNILLRSLEEHPDWKGRAVIVKRSGRGLETIHTILKYGPVEDKITKAIFDEATILAVFLHELGASAAKVSVMREQGWLWAEEICMVNHASLITRGMVLKMMKEMEKKRRVK